MYICNKCGREVFDIPKRHYAKGSLCTGTFERILFLRLTEPQVEEFLILAMFAAPTQLVKDIITKMENFLCRKTGI